MAELQSEFPEVSHSRMIKLREFGPGSRVENGAVLPNYYVPSVGDINFQLLRVRHGVRVAAFDLDNTLTKVGVSGLDDPETERYLRGLRDRGVLDKLIIATKSKRDTRKIEEAVGARRFVPPKGVSKPDRMYFEALLREARCRPEEAVMVGDRITHDISGAEAVGMVTVLVRPIGKGVLGGWIPTDFVDGTYRREQQALRAVREKLREISKPERK